MNESRIIKGDCLELLAQLPDKSIDLLVTDPPYCIGTSSNGTKSSWSDNNLIKPFFENTRSAPDLQRFYNSLNAIDGNLTYKNLTANGKES